MQVFLFFVVKYLIFYFFYFEVNARCPTTGSTALHHAARYGSDVDVVCPEKTKN